MSLEFIVQVAKNSAKPHFRFPDVGKRTNLCGHIPQVRTNDQCHLYYTLDITLTTHITKLLLGSFTSNLDAYEANLVQVYSG
jgi:hypothetical protein